MSTKTRIILDQVALRDRPAQRQESVNDVLAYHPREVGMRSAAPPSPCDVLVAEEEIALSLPLILLYLRLRADSALRNRRPSRRSTGQSPAPTLRGRTAPAIRPHSNSGGQSAEPLRARQSRHRQFRQVRHEKWRIIAETSFWRCQMGQYSFYKSQDGSVGRRYVLWVQTRESATLQARILDTIPSLICPKQSPICQGRKRRRNRP